jgi:hypothetical protein
MRRLLLALCALGFTAGCATAAKQANAPYEFHVGDERENRPLQPPPSRAASDTWSASDRPFHQGIDTNAAYCGAPVSNCIIQ